MKLPKVKIIITCEHGGYKVPREFQSYFPPSRSLRKSHKGWDPGALDLSQSLAKNLNAPLFSNSMSRLLIDFNRSVDHPSCFSPWTRHWESQKKQILLSSFNSYKNSVIQEVEAGLKTSQFIAVISVHSFAPKWNGKVRPTDLGLLFRPQIEGERVLAAELKTHLINFTGLKVHFNLPYRGHTNCFVNELSQQFLPRGKFVGMMLEVNTRLIQDSKKWSIVKMGLASSLKAVLG